MTTEQPRPGVPVLPKTKILSLRNSGAEYEDDLQAACEWGANEQLRLCVEWVSEYCSMYSSDTLPEDALQSVMRPKPPSIKQQALEALSRMDRMPTTADAATIRRALEALPDDC